MKFCDNSKFLFLVFFLTYFYFVLPNMLLNYNILIFDFVPQSKEAATKIKKCEFHENYTRDMYFTYSSVANPKRYLSFNMHGKPTKNKRFKNTKFMKMSGKSQIDYHNRKLADILPSSTTKNSSQKKHQTRHRHENRKYAKPKRQFLPEI